MACKIVPQNLEKIISKLLGASINVDINNPFKEFSNDRRQNVINNTDIRKRKKRINVVHRKILWNNDYETESAGTDVEENNLKVQVHICE